MPRPTVNAVMDLETLYWIPDPLRDQDLEADVDVWPVYFKIDGTTASVSDAPDNEGKLVGTATTSGTTGVGAAGRLTVGGSVAIPPAIGRWATRLVPIPLGPGLMLGPDTGAIFGAAVAVVQPSDLGTDALIAGHAALNAGVQTALDTLIADLAPYQQSIDPGDVDALAKAVQDGVEAAVKGALGVWDQIYEELFDLVLFGNTLMRFNQDDLPLGLFDQVDFDPASGAGPTPFPSGTVGQIGLSGSISQARRQVGQGVLSRFDRGVRAVAGYADASGYQHAIVGTDDGNVSELWWQPPAAVGRGRLTHFDSSIVALDGFYAATGYHHVIVATSDHLVTELWWQGPDAPGRGTLYRFSSPVTAVTGFYSGDGYHHAVVATQDGNLAELWWQGPDPAGQGNLTHLASPVVDLAGYWTPDGVHHVVAVTKDGTVTELRWSGSAAAELTTIAQVEAYPWSSPIGIGAYDAPADGQQHAIVAMSDGVLRELHWTPGISAGVLHDDLGVVADARPLIGAYYDASGYQHAIAGSGDGAVHELWWPSVHRRVVHGWDHELQVFERP